MRIYALPRKWHRKIVISINISASFVLRSYTFMVFVQSLVMWPLRIQDLKLIVSFALRPVAASRTC